MKKKRFKELGKYIEKHTNIADLGIGKGYYYSGLNYKNVVGVDINHFHLKRINREYPRIKTIKRDARDTGLPDKVFDLVVLSQIIYQLKDYNPLIKEAVRICKDDGYFLIGVPINAVRNPHFYPIWKEKDVKLLADKFGKIIDIKNLESCWLIYIKKNGRTT